MVSDPNLTFILDPECKWEYLDSDSTKEEDDGGHLPGPSNSQPIGGTSYRRQPRKGVCGPPQRAPFYWSSLFLVRRRHGFTFPAIQEQQRFIRDMPIFLSFERWVKTVFRVVWKWCVSMPRIYIMHCNARVWHLFTILWKQLVLAICFGCYNAVLF